MSLESRGLAAAYAKGRAEIRRQNEEERQAVSCEPLAVSCESEPTAHSPQPTATDSHRLNLIVIAYASMGPWLRGAALRALVAENPVDLERRGWIRSAYGPGRFDGPGWAPAGPVAARLALSAEPQPH
jgi:hypothetical protein